MIQHLSAEQISQWMVGDRTPQLERHVAECGECRSELEQLESTLVQFRGALGEWSGSAAPPAWRQPVSRSLWLSWPRLILAAAALLVLVALPVSWRARVRERAAETERADSQLLERVDSAISRAVPEPMEPLVNLVAWNSSPAQKNRKVERQ
jgi:anti-sigma factor RsiW